ncbi:hypothetical protein CsSME_00029633 [Camellia sinensis var. sinensis]
MKLTTICRSTSFPLPVRVSSPIFSFYIDDTTCPRGTGQANPRLPHRCPITGSTGKPAQESNGERESPSEPSDEQFYSSRSFNKIRIKKTNLIRN